MANIKTAISIQESLFSEINVLAHKMHVSRSKLFAKAMEAFLQKYKNKNLLEQINAAYDDTVDLSQKKWQKQIRKKHHKLVEAQW